MTAVSSNPLTAPAEGGSDVGGRCQYKPCNLYDFLPYKCDSCQHIFCDEHRHEYRHECKKAGEWATRRREQNIAKPSIGAGEDKPEVGRPCASPACENIIGIGRAPAVSCDVCKRDYCMDHRFIEKHNCSTLIPIGGSSGGSVSQRALNFCSGFRTKLKSTTIAMSGRTLPKAKPSSTSARLAALNTLKKTAKGDMKIPREKRIYIYVEAEAATTKSKLPKGGFFYSKEWAVGRVLDAAAKSLQVENTNNQSTDEASKLRVFHVEGGRLLEFGEKLGEALVSGNTIVLLRGVGPAIPNLIVP